MRRQQYLEEAEHCDTFIAADETLKHLIDASQSSGSGSGLPLLVTLTGISLFLIYSIKNSFY